jgi:hypothetical protein
VVCYNTVNGPFWALMSEVRNDGSIEMLVSLGDLDEVVKVYESQTQVEKLVPVTSLVEVGT